MNEEKTIQISAEAMSAIDRVLTSINELSGSFYNQSFGFTKSGILGDSEGRDSINNGFKWFYDNYDLLQSVMLSIRTLSEFGIENIPPYCG